jgi:hypothetical protein
MKDGYWSYWSGVIVLLRVSVVSVKPANAKKDEFYETLQTEQDNLVGNKILMGNINDRLDRDNTGIERYLGPYGEEAKNDNGERLIELLITNSKFKHKDINKFIRIAPFWNEKSITDYFIMKKENFRTLKDVKVKRGVEIGSDHHLLIMQMTIDGKM